MRSMTLKSASGILWRRSESSPASVIPGGAAGGIVLSAAVEQCLRRGGAL